MPLLTSKGTFLFLKMYREKFIQFIQYEKRYSPHTVLAYKNDLSQFFTYIKETFDIERVEEIESQHIRSWIVAQMDNHLHKTSINRKITSLKSFYKFLKKEKVISVNPMDRVISPKKEKILPQFIEKEKINNLIDSTPFEGDEFTVTRDKLIVELFYATGIRLSELVNLKTANVDIYNCTIKVLGKGNKERIIPFYPTLKKSIQYYIGVKKNVTDSEDFFFVTLKGDKIYPKLVYRVVYKYLSAITTTKKKSPHVLRHTFATHMLNNGADINAIKELLGHANLSATQIYTHNSIEKLLSIYKQAHPKS